MKYKIISKQFNSRRCIVCGLKNRASLRAEFFNAVDEDNKPCLITRCVPKWFHQSYPDRLHGGIISAILDESIGRAVQATDPNIWAVTIDLSVKFRKPTPLDKPIYAVSYITKFGTRAFDGEGKLLLADGTVLASAIGKFFIIPFEELTKAKGANEIAGINSAVTTKGCPEFIEIG